MREELQSKDAEIRELGEELRRCHRQSLQRTGQVCGYVGRGQRVLYHMREGGREREGEGGREGGGGRERGNSI